jgi:hypothetical protein
MLLGVKDTINTRFVTDSPSVPAIKEQMEDLDMNHPTCLYNPFLRLEGMIDCVGGFIYLWNHLFIWVFHSAGFDGAHDSPAKILHVVLLGVVKYLAWDNIGKLKLKQQKTLVGRLHLLNTLLMNIDSLKADYLVKHIKSLVGRHFKIILQAAPFVLLDFLTLDRKVIWLSLFKLCAFIFQTRISDMDVYLE